MTNYQKNKLIILLVLGLISLFIFYRFSENGRYEFKSERKVVVDTRSGDLYILSRDTIIDISKFH